MALLLQVFSEGLDASPYFNRPCHLTVTQDKWVDSLGRLVPKKIAPCTPWFSDTDTRCPVPFSSARPPKLVSSAKEASKYGASEFVGFSWFGELVW